jgi:hypothetical protein
MRPLHLCSRIFMAVSCLLLIGSATTSAQRRRPSNESPRKLTLDEEARQEAEKYWEHTFARCGDSFIAKSFYDRDDLAKVSPVNVTLYLGKDIFGYRILELKGRQIITEGSAPREVPLSEADILNGVKAPTPGHGLQWSGHTTFRWRVGRVATHNVDDPPGKLTWSQWADFGDAPTVNMDKRDGRWNFSSGGVNLTVGGVEVRFRRVPVKCDLSDVETAGTNPKASTLQGPTLPNTATMSVADCADKVQQVSESTEGTTHITEWSVQTSEPELNTHIRIGMHETVAMAYLNAGKMFSDFHRETVETRPPLLKS